MDFKKATDVVLSPIDHGELAAALDSSIAAIRQARLSPAAKAHRSPPKGWEKAVVRLAKRRIAEYQALVDVLDKGDQPVMGLKSSAFTRS